MKKAEKGYRIPYKRVEVVWDDASSNSESWVEIADIESPERVNTTGWLVKETEVYVTVASSVSGDGKGESIVGNTMTIPRGMIVSIKELRIAISRAPNKLHTEPVAAPVHREPREG